MDEAHVKVEALFFEKKHPLSYAVSLSKFVNFREPKATSSFIAQGRLCVVIVVG